MATDDDGGGSTDGGGADDPGSEVADDSTREVAEIYAENCGRCHGSNGEGGVGPNLADSASLPSSNELIEGHCCIEADRLHPWRLVRPRRGNYRP